jgi:hypothetical protein
MAKPRHNLLLSVAFCLSTTFGLYLQAASAADNQLDAAIAASKIIDVTHVLGPGPRSYAHLCQLKMAQAVQQE